VVDSGVEDVARAATTPDGGYLQVGDINGPLVDAATKNGLRLICVDRPGTSGRDSTTHSCPTTGRWPAPFGIAAGEMSRP
jgi:hypothetical protein